MKTLSAEAYNNNIAVFAVLLSRMARWPKTPVELETCIGAEGVCSFRRERELCCLMCTVGTVIGCIDIVKSE